MIEATVSANSTLVDENLMDKTLSQLLPEGEKRSGRSSKSCQKTFLSDRIDRIYRERLLLFRTKSRRALSILREISASPRSRQSKHFQFAKMNIFLRTLFLSFIRKLRKKVM